MMDDETAKVLHVNPPSMGNHPFGQAVGIPAPPPQLLPMNSYRSNCLQGPINLRERFKRSWEYPLMGYISVLPSTENIRLMATSGYDFIMLDWEHTPMGIREICDLVRLVNMASEGNTAAVVRVPNHDHHHITWALDAGASGVIVPHVDTADQAKAIVKMCRYGSAGGTRSFGLGCIPGHYDGLSPDTPDMRSVWNNIAVIMQIESARGCTNAGAIAAIPGVDGIMVGNADLRLDLGLGIGLDGTERIYTDHLDLVITAARKHDLTLLSLTLGPDNLKRRLAQGFRGLLVGNDGWALAAAMRNGLQQSHQAYLAWREGEGQQEEQDISTAAE